MIARPTLILSAVALASALTAPAAFAGSAPPPVKLAPGERVVSHTTTSEKDSQYIISLLSAIQGVKIGADKTTVLVDNGGKIHPIEIDYGKALSGTAKASAVGISGKSSDAHAKSADGNSGAAEDPAGSSGGIGLGQVAGMLLGLTIISRLVGIVRQLGGGRR